MLPLPMLSLLRAPLLRQQSPARNAIAVAHCVSNSRTRIALAAALFVAFVEFFVVAINVVGVNIFAVHIFIVRRTNNNVACGPGA